MRSLFAISLVVLVCFTDHSYGTFVDFLSNLPNEISRAFSVAWGSVEEAIKQPVKIIRIGPGGNNSTIRKLKTTTVAYKTYATNRMKTEYLPDRQINWQPEQVLALPPTRRIEWHLERKPNGIFERTQNLKQKLERQHDRQLKQQQQHEQQQNQQQKRPHEWPRKWQPELTSKPQPEQKPQQKHQELKLERQPQRKLGSDNTMKRPESYIVQQPERQPDQALSRQNKQYNKLLFNITEFRKSRSKVTIPFLEKPKNRPSSHNVMRFFYGQQLPTII